MAQQDGPGAQPGLIKRIWRATWRPSARYSMGLLLIVGILGGVLFWGGFNWALELTNSETFCISCHEMRDNPYKELQSTIHFKNRSGVRATCPDCHVPHPWIWKMKRKIEASNEVFHKLMGTIDTPEKYEEHRLELAQHVWKTMSSTDSRECRNCHQEHSMDPAKQQPKAAKEMQEGFAKGMTCIDCHKGIAHHMPKIKDPLDDDDDADKNAAGKAGEAKPAEPAKSEAPKADAPKADAPAKN